MGGKGTIGVRREEKTYNRFAAQTKMNICTYVLNIEVNDDMERTTNTV